MGEDVADGAVTKAVVVGDDGVQAFEEGAEGVLVEQEDQARGGSDEVARKRECGEPQAVRAWLLPQGEGELGCREDGRGGFEAGGEA